MIYQLHRSRKQRPTRWLIALPLIALSTVACSLGFAAASSTSTSPADSNPGLIIVEIKSGGTNTQPSQYVTIYNPTETTVSMDGWYAEYAKQDFPGQHCSLSNWDSSAPTLVNQALFHGDLPPGSVSTPLEIAINDTGAGALHLIDANNDVRDTVGWGNPEHPAPCSESNQAIALAAGKSLQRYMSCDGKQPVDSDDNSLDFTLSSTPSPGSLGTATDPACPGSEVPDSPTPLPIPDNPTPTLIQGSCKGVLISELLPNPAGSDGGKEFIELYNPTVQSVSLQGCELQSSASSSIRYAFIDEEIPAGSYLVVTDVASKLVLPNASGGTVWLNDTTSELQQVDYPADMTDDVSWALVDGVWSATYTSTPGSLNIATPLKPCDDALVRNPETNRCVTAPEPAAPADASSTTSTGTASSAPCKAGQERNPATNRCRTIPANNAGTTACKAGQERNPETNRCRAVSAAAAIKSCPQGQERNPETNRCRKVSPAAAGASAKVIENDNATPGGSSSKTWLIILLAVALAASYGIYEWRQEITLWVKRKYDRLTRRSRPLPQTQQSL